MAVNIPQEIMVEILSRLPAKSLIRFRCVSKPWCNLIFDSTFTKLHLTRAIERDDLTLITTKHERFVKELEFTYEDTDGDANGIGPCAFVQTYIYCLEQGDSFQNEIKIKHPLGAFAGGDAYKLLGSCNGVVCLVRENEVCLLNPYTREYKVVEFEKDFGFPCHDPHYYLGYDDTTKGKEDYTLVHFQNSDHSESQINVYSFYDTLCFTISNVPYRIDVEGQSGTFLNGAHHWIAGNEYKLCTELVISFDIGEKVVREIARPDNVAKDANDEDLMTHLTLGIIGGQLALFKMYSTYRSATIAVDIWVMKIDGECDQWCKLFSTKRATSLKNKFDDRTMRPLHFTKDAVVLLQEDINLVLYDLKGKKTRKFNIHAKNWFKNKKIVTHVASLVSLKSGSYVPNTIGVEDKDCHLSAEEKAGYKLGNSWVLNFLRCCRSYFTLTY